MFENDAVSRRNVLKTTGGLIAGSTALVSFGAEGGAALPNFDDFIVEVQEMNEEYIAVEARLPEDYSYDGEMPILMGHADRFVIREDTVSLPEDTEAFARPVEMDFENPHDVMMYFRTRDVDLSEAEGEEVMLGLGLFEERTIPHPWFDTCPGHRDY